ncbi:MAG: YIP1 family protein [Candidatus Acidiferrales bacterium]
MNQQQVSTEPMGELGRLGGVLFDPKPAFADIVQRPRWWVPLALLAALSVIFITLFSQRVGWEQVVRKAIESNPQTLERIPADRREDVIRQQAGISRTVGYVFSVLGMPLFALVLTGVFLFVFNLLAGASDVRFQPAFAVVCYSLLPFGVRGVLAGVMMYVQSPAEFDIQNPVMSNLAAVLDPNTTPAWLLAVLRSADLFNLWVVLLIATGFSVLARKMPWGRAFGWVLGAWLVWLLLVGFGSALFS